MSAPMTSAARYVGWVDRHRRAILAGNLVALAVAIYLVAFRLPLYADLAYLLPKDAQSVVDLHKLEARLTANDTLLVVVDAPDAASRASATAELSAAIHRIPSKLVVRVDEDQAEARAFLREHRFMLVPEEDLQRAYSSLKHRIDAAKLASNPLFVNLDDEHETAKADADAKQQIADLRRQRREIDETLDRPSNVSKSLTRALVEVRTAMPATDIANGKALLAALDAARAPVLVHHPGVTIGFAGDLVTAIAEHDAIATGTLISSIATSVLVGLVLALYFRSLRLLVLLVGTTAFGTVAAFAVSVFSVGHLNAATAFLGAIIAGNGINYGILLIGRFLEERDAHTLEGALAAAIERTLRPTAIASLGAAIAYGSLAATDFKGFSDFAIIGSVGMLLCWIATYFLLPALVLTFARGTRGVVTTRGLERLLVRVLGVRRPLRVAIVGGALALAAGGIVAHYIASDPFEYDMRKLGSIGEANKLERAWMHVAEVSFGRGRAGRTYIAAERDDQVPEIVAALRRSDRRDAIGSVQSILDVVPEHQPQRRELLVAIRDLLDDPDLEELSDAERAELLELRPPDKLELITRSSLPPSIVDALSERDGRVGLLVSVRPGDKLDELNGHDVLTFATAVRSLDLGHGHVVTTSGASVIFADILQTISRDGPLVTALAIGGIVVMLLVTLGVGRRALAVFIATTGGSLFMVATCAIAGLKVSFLDFVALPITLGLGVDYAINVAHRQLDENDPITTLRTSGVAVFICSLTTMIGYGSLLVSDNLAIRGFGTASLIGEITTVLTALVLVPTALSLHRGSRRS